MSTISDAQIAADMALAALSNRASWEQLDKAQRRIAASAGQPRSRTRHAPLFLDAYLTAKHGRPIWVQED